MSRSTGAAGLLALAVAGALPGKVAAQSAADPAARCAQLGAAYDRTSARGRGSGGANMTRTGAQVDCSNGRYDKGIKALEDLLRNNHIAIPD